MHSHKTHEEITKCALHFGLCWQNASRIASQKSEKLKAHNKPAGANADDKRNDY